ncbi:MAG: tetratricopeptide repeat protein [Bacteroidota bacterium]|nr:tetratricopeptide repeat protein [Bacteroidota bacterium]
MKSFKTTILVCVIIFSQTIVAQSKKERAVESKSVAMDMYNSSQNTEALEFYSKGSEKLGAGDYKGAIKLFEKAIDKDPKFVEAYDDMGVSYRKLGDFKNAIKNYEKSIELYPNGAMAHQNLGMIYAIQKEFQKALNEYETSQKLKPEDPEGYYGTVNIYLQLGEYKKAINNAKKTLDIYEATKNPYIADAQYLLGMSYYYDKDNKNAKTFLELAKKGGAPVDPKVLKDVQ